jgi:ribose transport system substrate-binding protein
VGSLQQRDKGFLSVIKKHPNIHVVAHRYGKADAAQALQTTEELLTAHPNLVGIFADNNLMADGAGRVFASKKSTRSKVLVSFDADSKILSYIKDGAIDASIVQDPYMIGFDGVMYGVMAHYGAKLPAFTDTVAKAITKQNVNTPALKGFLHPHQRKLKPYTGPGQ